MSVEKCNEIIRDVGDCCILEKFCIDVDIFTNTPIFKQYYYTSSSTFVVKSGSTETVELENTCFALLICVEDGEAIVYLENQDGEELGEILEWSIT